MFVSRSSFGIRAMWMNAASLESGGDRSLGEWASANGATASAVSRRPPIERSPRKPRKGGDAAIRHGMAETKGRGLQRLTAPQRDETIIARREGPARAAIAAVESPQSHEARHQSRAGRG